MSLCVTRQYHALRVARSAALQLRPGACSLTSSRIALRFHQSALYSSSSDPGSPPNSAIIVPRSLAVSPETLVKHIVPLQKHHYRKSRFAVFFVTPSFAPWLLDDHKFLTKAVHQAFLPLLADDKYAKVHSLIAVVDKLPTPLSVDGTKSVEDEITSRIHTPPVSDVGHEGVGYMYLRPQDFAGSVERTGFDQNGTIGFTIAEGSTKNGQFLDLLQLPLANTVFQTGSPATMTLSTWEKQKESREFTLTNKSDLVHQTLRIHTPESADPPNAFAIPLVPMTSPRQVEASMGNIVRRVLDPSGKSVTASEELEKTVPQYFKARGEPSQSISVWALLIPRDLVDSIQAETTALLSKANTQVSSTDTASWDNLWSKKSTAWNDIVTSALSKGARLHRVLSGGGGWGKKAGLLSLDPSFNNEELVTSAVQDLPSDMQALDELSSALHQVVQDGDSVQFFVSPAADLDTNDQSEVLNKISESENLWSYEFGMIPSTADALETRSWQRNNAASQDVTVFRNTFGALSEGGMTMKRQILGDKGQHIIAGGTKIDVPFSRYSSIEPAEDKPTLRIHTYPSTPTLTTTSLILQRFETLHRNLTLHTKTTHQLTHALRHQTLQSLASPATKSDLPSFLQTLTSLTNASALSTYTLHLSLRWRLASLIRHSSTHYPQHLKLLEPHLVYLRLFNADLFASDAHVYTGGKGRPVHAWLLEREYARRGVRELRLSGAATRVLKRLRRELQAGERRSVVKAVGVGGGVVRSVLVEGRGKRSGGVVGETSGDGGKRRRVRGLGDRLEKRREAEEELLATVMGWLEPKGGGVEQSGVDEVERSEEVRKDVGEGEKKRVWGSQAPSVVE